MLLAVTNSLTLIALVKSFVVQAPGLFLAWPHASLPTKMTLPPLAGAINLFYLQYGCFGNTTALLKKTLLIMTLLITLINMTLHICFLFIL